MTLIILGLVFCVLIVAGGIHVTFHYTDGIDRGAGFVLVCMGLLCSMLLGALTAMEHAL